MRVVDCGGQGTDAWKSARCGVITATRMKNVCSTINSGEAAGRRNCRAEMICEILTGQPTDDIFVTADMLRGKELEADARRAYEMATLQTVTQVDFVLHPTNDHIGCSPDGLVGDDGMVEIKVPKTGTHLEYINMGLAPAEYRKQMYTQMLCCERKWCDFVSYDPRLPTEYQLFIIRFHRDERELILMEATAIEFLREVYENISNMKNKPMFIGV